MYGFLACIYSDQGANFESSLIAELLLLAWVGECQAERVNHTLGDMKTKQRVHRNLIMPVNFLPLDIDNNTFHFLGTVLVRLAV